jgi:hypothetical protein
MATKWRLHIEQNPNVRLASSVQTRTLLKPTDALAWHILEILSKLRDDIKVNGIHTIG